MVVEAWHRRHAVQILAALPESIEDAMHVLSIVQEMITPAFGFVSRPVQPLRERDLGNVVSLSSATSGSSR